MQLVHYGMTAFDWYGDNAEFVRKLGEHVNLYQVPDGFFVESLEMDDNGNEHYFGNLYNTEFEATKKH